MIRKIHLFFFCFLILLCIGNVSANDESNGADVYLDESHTLEQSDIGMACDDVNSFDLQLSNENEVADQIFNTTIDERTYGPLNNGSSEVNMDLNQSLDEDFKTIFDNPTSSAINRVAANQINTKLIGEKNIDLPYKEGKYTVTLVDGDNGRLAHKIVTFTVLGKDYKIKTDENGVASLPINLNKGSYTITVKFEEYGYVSSSITSVINVKVLDTVIITNPANFTTKNQTYVLRIVDQYNRPVQNHEGCCDLGKYTYYFRTDKDGFATLNLTLPMGIYEAKFTSFISSGYMYSFAQNKIIVNRTDYNITSYDFETFVDSGFYYYVSVKDENNIPPNVNLKTNIYKDGRYLKTIGTKIHDDGIACIKLDLGPGTYTFKNHINLNYGFPVYNEVTITIKPAKVIVNSSNLKLNRKGEYFTVTFKNSENNKGIANHVVYFKIKDVTYKTVTNEKGEAKLQINLNNGNYPISYYFEGNSKYENLNGTNTIWKWQYVLDTTLTPLNTEIFRKGTYYQVVLKDSSGIPLKNQVVYITVKGVSYKCVTDNEGIARLKINLWDGNYVIKAEFKDCSSFKGAVVSNPLSVNTAPNFNYTLDFSRYMEEKGLKCTNIREFDVTYGDKHYNLCSDETKNGFYQITNKKFYLISSDGLESNYQTKQGIEFKILGENLQIIFYGRTPDISQFSVIYNCNNYKHKLQFVIDNEVVATVVMELFFYEEEFRKLCDSGFFYLGNEFVNSSFKCQNHEMKRIFQFSDGYELSVRGVEKSDNFKAIQTYMIDYKKIPDSFIEKEFKKAESFNGQYDRYAYDFYLAALSLLANSDTLCDNLSEMFNVTWDKNFHLVLVTLDWSGLTIDSHVPLAVNGDKNHTFCFRALHGLLFSYLEEAALQATGNEAKSTITNVFNALTGGEDFAVSIIKNTLTLSLLNSDDKIILDLDTGVVTTLTSSDFMDDIILKGSYAYFKLLPNDPFSLNYFIYLLKHDLEGLWTLFSSVTPKKIFLCSKVFLAKCLTATVTIFSEGVLSPSGYISLGIAFGELTVEYRDRFAPNNTKQYFSYSKSIWDMKIIHIKNPNTQFFDRVEIPLDKQGNMVMDDAVYISSFDGAHDITPEEKVMVEEYIKQKRKDGFYL